MSKGDVHTVPHGDGWAKRGEGNTSACRTPAATKAEAQKRARAMPMKARA
jgi:hypothetical protein